MTYLSNNHIRAVFDDSSVRVYQAYNHAIADAALAEGSFISPSFKMERMTWIKPSFLWMMYRAGWGRKDAGQSRILAIDITRDGLEWALAHACLSHSPPGMTPEGWALLKRERPVRVQWDPERDLHLQPLPHRAIQIGLTGEAVIRYVRDWTLRITDVTSLAHEIEGLITSGSTAEAQRLLPAERAYPALNIGHLLPEPGSGVEQ